MTTSGNTDLVSTAFDGMKDNDDHRKSRFENLSKQNRFFELKHQRDAQRLEYIRQGILPDPDKAQDLSAAKSLLGTCLEMCPEFEREEREFQSEGDTLEMFSGTNRIDPALAVKIYRRPAAGRELPLPEDVRPPAVLRQTLDYLFHRLLPSDPSSSQFTAVQPFMWNRTRAIRQDFIVQGLRGALEIECHERIARYHILCLHWKGGIGADNWSEQQELEQLRKTIRSLTEFYEDFRRSTGKSSVNEAEFRAYSLLLHMQDPETLREVETLPLEVFDSPSVQAALRLRGYAQRSNNVIKRGRPLNSEATMNLWTRFFNEIKNGRDVSYLLACLAENAFSQVRSGAIKAMGKTYLIQHAPLPLTYIRRSLDMDSNVEARSFAVALNCEEVRADGPDSPVTAMRLTKANEDKPLPSAPFSNSIVEIKRGSHSSQDIVDGKLSGAASLLPIEEAGFLDSLQSTGQSKIPFTTTKVQATSDSTSSFPSPFPAAPVSTPSSFTPSFPATSAFGSNLSAKAPIFTPSAFSSSQKPLGDTPALQSPPTFSPVKAPTPLQSFTFASSQPQPQPQTPSVSAPPSTPASRPAFSFGIQSNISNHSSAAASVESPSVMPAKSAAPISKPLDLTTDPAAAITHKSHWESPAKPTVATPVSPAKPSKPARTLASVSSSLTTSLIEEFLTHKLSSICQQACLREVRIRRREARTRFIIDAREHLYETVKADIMDDTIAEIASEAIAEEFRIRCLERLVIRKRRNAVDQVLERKRKAEAWKEIEQRVREIESLKLNQQSLPAAVPLMKKKKRSIEEAALNKSQKDTSKLRRIDIPTSATNYTTLGIESLRAMMASAAQLLD